MSESISRFGPAMDKQTDPVRVNVSDLRDLPELESVESRPILFMATAALFWILITGAGAALVATIFVFGRHFLSVSPVQLQDFAVAIGVSAVLIGPVLIRLPWFEWRYKTDRTGITAYGLASERRLTWSAVTSAQTKSSSGSVTYRLKSDKIRMDVPVAMGQNAFVAASVWQHLKRVGKAGSVLPPAEALSIWTPIPDSVPDEIDWNNPERPILNPRVVFIALLVLAALVWTFYDADWLDRLLGHFGHALWGGIVWVYAAVRSRFLVVRRVMVRTYRIEAQTEICRMDLDWDRVTVARWAHGTFTVGTKGFGNVAAIPFDPDDPSTADTILAIIRHLRNRHDPVPIPIPEPLQSLPLLLKSADEEIPDRRLAESVTEGRPFIYSLLGVAGLIAATGFFLALSPLGTRSSNALMLALPVLLLGILWFTTYRVRLDEQGITVSRLWTSRRVEWWQVATYEILHGEAVTGSVLRLKDGNGKVLFAYGPVQDGTDRPVRDYLDARLEKVRKEEHRSQVPI